MKLDMRNPAISIFFFLRICAECRAIWEIFSLYSYNCLGGLWGSKTSSTFWNIFICFLFCVYLFLSQTFTEVYFVILLKEHNHGIRDNSKHFAFILNFCTPDCCAPFFFFFPFFRSHTVKTVTVTKLTGRERNRNKDTCHYSDWVGQLCNW